MHPCLFTRRIGNTARVAQEMDVVTEVALCLLSLARLIHALIVGPCLILARGPDALASARAVT